MIQVRSLLTGRILITAALLAACSDGTERDPLGVDQQALGSGSGGSGGFAMALPIPSVLSPTTTDDTTDHYDITIETGSTQMKPGSLTPIVGFNGVFPGPTIVATRGRTALVTQTNAWTENVTIHNHGHKAAASSDGHPIDYILPGESKTYVYPNDQSGSTYWYHDHTMDLTAEHVYKGLAGFYILHDPAEDSLDLPSGAYDVPLLLQDKQFNSDNTLRYDGTRLLRGFFGDTAVVNGAVTPHLDVSARKYRFRVLNGSNARTFEIALSGGASFEVIASDGGLLEAPVTVTRLRITPGERYDIVVDFSSYGVGSHVVLNNDDGARPSIDALMQFRVTGTVVDTSAVPAKLRPIIRHTADQAVSTVNITFSRDNGDWLINGLTYDPARIDVSSTLDTVYVWKLRNNSGEMHPFHKHLTEFNVLDINGRAPAAEQNGWKDTVAVPAGGSARIVFTNQGFTGTYVFHCHKMEHEDHRMMLQEDVH